MCGRFVATTSPAQIADTFGVEELRVDADRGPDFNVAPTRQVMAVVDERVTPSVPPDAASATDAGTLDVHRVLETLRWGLVPHWAKDLAIGNKMINARAETVAEKNAFRSPLRARRCIVPADGFYEWQAPAGGSGKKQPWFIHAADGGLLAFAGLWDVWHGPDGDIATCTVITTAANTVMAPVHDRMPVILPRDVWDVWLDPDLHDVAALTALLRPADDATIVRYRIGSAVGNVRNNDPHLLDPAPEQPGLL